MTESNAKSKVQRASRAGDARKPAAKAGKPAAKARKTANAGTKPVKSDGDGTALAGEKSNGQASGKSASRLIDQRIRALEGWRGETLARMRALILEADPEVTEEWKWKGTPVWSHNGILCTGEAYSKVVKLTFARGASLPDPSRLFNASLEGNTRRAIDIREGEKVDARRFKALVKAAVAQNGPPAKKARPGAKPSKPVKLLSGGNPQIAKADGDAAVQAYIAAMPGWKHDVGKRLDMLITRTVPDVRKAVRWNSPFYGIEGQGWFLSFHCITKYVKVAFFRGTSLDPPPPVESRHESTRYFHIHENDPFDEKLVESWIRQASELPGEACF